MTDRCRLCHEPVIRIFRSGMALDRNGTTLAPHQCAPTTPKTDNNPKDAA